ncbi:hypothetical protein ES703_109212 [subsurface metagenome]|jgi:hypothetical protein
MELVFRERLSGKPPSRLHLRPEARRLWCHQARAAPSLRHRAHHRSHEGRRPSRPQLPQRPRRRRRQRRPLSRGPPPHPRLAERTLVPVPVSSMAHAGLSSPAQFGFLTDDHLGSGALYEVFPIVRAQSANVADSRSTASAKSRLKSKTTDRADCSAFIRPTA